MPKVHLCICLCSWKEECLITSSLCECIFLNERHIATFQQCKEFTGSSCLAPNAHTLLHKEAGMWMSHLNMIKLTDRWKLTNAMKSTRAVQLSYTKCIWLVFKIAINFEDKNATVKAAMTSVRWIRLKRFLAFLPQGPHPTSIPEQPPPAGVRGGLCVCLCL